jgi:Ca2+-binding RTX toxin-like protein
MEGGEGDDTYYVADVDDVTFEDSNDAFVGGVDSVVTSVTHTLQFGIEYLYLAGSAAINGAGNELANEMLGNSANNVLSGLDGNDILTGGTGNDTLNGGNGNDVLTGGSGRDLLNGGAGADRLDYNAVSESPAGTGRDVITGFAGAGAALGDQLDLRDIDASTLVTGNQAFIFGGPFTAGHLRYVGGVLQGNTDGDAAAEFEIQLIGTPALTVGGTGTDILL